MIARGHLYDQDSSNRVAARISVHGDRYSLKLSNAAAELPVDVVSVSPFISGIPQRLVLSTGQTFVPLDELPDGFLTTRRNRFWKALSKIEKFSLRNVTICVVLFVATILSIRAALPLAADTVAGLIPRSLEATIGAQTFAQFEDLILEDSQLSPTRRASLIQKASGVSRRSSLERLPEIHFRNAPKIGANAFAFPGGPIVVTDQLVNTIENDEAVVAVIAHELGHIEERHSLRQILRAAGLFFMASTILGADEVIIEELSALALGLATSGYSRGFENAADAYAARLLQEAGYQPERLIQSLEALANACEPPCAEGSWFATHPGYEERIEALRKLVQ